MDIIGQLNTAKTCQNADTPTKIIKLTKDIFAKFIGNNFNPCIMIEKFKEAIDKGHEFGTLLTDLSKVFDCIDHKILIAKLYSYVI